MSRNSRFRFDLTPIETVVVAVAIALTIATAISLRGRLAGQEQVDEMKQSINALATQQESYLYDHSIYAGTHDQLVGLVANPNVTVTVMEATLTGWSAIASHRSSIVRCSLFVGNAAPLAGATTEGIVACV